MRSFLSSAALSKEEIGRLFERADHFRTHKSDVLRDKIVGLLFFENSSRTRASFEMAALRLGASVVFIGPEGSSIQKGETELDTARVLSCNGADILVVRTGQDGTPAQIADATGLPVLNAGEGALDHPSQGLLDAYTLTRQLGDLEGKIIAIVGDIAHSRVAASNAAILTTLGAHVRFVGPDGMRPETYPNANVSLHNNLEEGLHGVDAVMALRIQKERLPAGFSVLSDYTEQFGITVTALAHAKPGAVVLHPMPMNRGVEISDEVADGPYSLIYRQMENGLYIRMSMYEAAL